MKNITFLILATIIFALILGCSDTTKPTYIMDVNGLHEAPENAVWLTHEHILVDFIGADNIQPETWDHDKIISSLLPYLQEIQKLNVDYFVDATPAYLGRDVLLLKKITDITGIRIMTNTGLYGAVENRYIPSYAYALSAEELAEIWIDEFENGIDNTSIRPGFIKIGVDSHDPLDPMHEKLVKAAAITHLETGLIIASHTGRAEGLWPQLKILDDFGVAPEALIWVHAQQEADKDSFLKAAETGCWVSLDGMGWEMEDHVKKIAMAKEHGFLDRVLISHDAGWYDPQKEVQSIIPFTAVFNTLIPELQSRGFTDDEIRMMLSVNPSRAFSIKKRTIN
ncbi:MAG: phosphotriesterase [Bacteroidetes bacterium]|nr:MAG: phosphotriesterase [Bacteroidota bacterium]